MDTEVSRTLAELERKLRDLELALASAGASTSAGASARAGAEQREEAAQAHAPSSDSPGEHQPSGARVVDESVDLSAGGREHAGAQGRLGEQEHEGAAEQRREPPHRPPDESIELVELVRFRDRLEHTMRDLVEDYERIIRLRAASEQSHAPIDEH